VSSVRNWLVEDDVFESARVVAPLPSLSLVVPAHNAAETLAACLQAVFAAAPPAQIIVVDDASTDATAEIAARFACELIRLPTNRGAAAARNVGAAAAQGDILFFLDSDILIAHDTLACIQRAFADDPTLAALFGSYQKNTTPQNFFSTYKNLLHHYTHQHSASDAATFCGGYGAVRREIFWALRGFDESKRALEDIEFGYRLHRAGYRIRLVKDLQFTHLKTYTLTSLVRSDVLNRAIPWTQLMLQHRIFRNDLNTKSNHVASVVVSFLILGAPLWGWFVPFAWLELGALLLLLCALNFDFLVFVTRERGFGFGLLTFMMCWFNYVYSGIGLGLGVGAFVWQHAWLRRT
jgi:glycosyltransferase involved in cell wall biosynthesis